MSTRRERQAPEFIPSKADRTRLATAVAKRAKRVSLADVNDAYIRGLAVGREQAAHVVPLD